MFFLNIITIIYIELGGPVLKFNYKNLVFSGGGVLGIAYLGALEYLYETNLIHSFCNLAGTSAGAITACLTCFNLSFKQLSALLETLDYTQIPLKEKRPIEDLRLIPDDIKNQFSEIFDNLDCLSRLIKHYGWYSSAYLYTWLQTQIASVFDSSKKAPPYTFSDFNNPSIHLHQKPFKNLYIVGTDVIKSTSILFSYETTPDMEVAEAVRISMSVPLLFESVQSNCSTLHSAPSSLYVDGGMLYNYPINLFDNFYDSRYTLGIYFQSTPRPRTINNLVDFISAALSCTGTVQDELLMTQDKNLNRSIPIQTGDVSAFDFNIKPHDETYQFLYTQGYRAAEIYFSLH